jgi:hypothetical protein
VTDPKISRDAALAAVTARLRSKAPLSELTEAFDALASALDEWCRAAPRQLSVRGVDGAPDWYGTETSTWQICEIVRRATRESVKMAGLRPIAESIEQFCALPSLGKGRVDWAAFAQDVGRKETAVRLATFLDDVELEGIVLAGLVRHRVPGHSRAAERIAASGRTGVGVRNARKYLKLGL